MTAKALEDGFRDAPIQAAQAYREVLEALARPGTIRHLAGALPPAPLLPAAGTLLLTLCNAETPLHLAGSRIAALPRTTIVGEAA